MVVARGQQSRAAPEAHSAKPVMDWSYIWKSHMFVFRVRHLPRSFATAGHPGIPLTTRLCPLTTVVACWAMYDGIVDLYVPMPHTCR